MAHVTVHTHIGLLAVKGASTVRKVVRVNGGKGSEGTNGPSMALEL
jgi:hypothetical protein